MVFETKKIQTETLAEYLAGVREHLGLDLGEVSKKTGIKEQFLVDLETGKFHHLPPTVYVLGFLRQLAHVYSINSKDLIDQYKKERNIEDLVSRSSNEASQETRKTMQRLVVTPKHISMIMGVVFVAATLLYVIWQVFSINKTPNLEIFQPQDRQIINGSAMEVTGRTDPGITVTINGQNVFVDDKGNFKTELGVGQGPKDLAFVAKNKFDKSATKTITVVGEASAVAVQGVSDKKVVLQLAFSGDATVTTVSDLDPPVTHLFKAGDSTEISAQDKIVLSTTDAGVTKAIFNNKDLGFLGRKKEPLKDIPFSAESDTIK